MIRLARNEQGRSLKFSGPERTCIGCRKPKNRDQLLRLALVWTNDRPKIVLDVKKNMPGRGAWICSQYCLLNALKKRDFARFFKIKGELNLDELVFWVNK